MEAVTPLARQVGVRASRNTSVAFVVVAFGELLVYSSSIDEAVLQQYPLHSLA